MTSHSGGAVWVIQSTSSNTNFFWKRSKTHLDIMFNQLSGYPVDQSGCHIKLTIIVRLHFPNLLILGGVTKFGGAITVSRSDACCFSAKGFNCQPTTPRALFYSTTVMRNRSVPSIFCEDGNVLCIVQDISC